MVMIVNHLETIKEQVGNNNLGCFGCIQSHQGYN